MSIKSCIVNTLRSQIRARAQQTQTRYTHQEIHHRMASTRCPRTSLAQVITISRYLLDLKILVLRSQLFLRWMRLLVAVWFREQVELELAGLGPGPSLRWTGKDLQIEGVHGEGPSAKETLRDLPRRDFAGRVAV